MSDHSRFLGGRGVESLGGHQIPCCTGTTRRIERSRRVSVLLPPTRCGGDPPRLPRRPTGPWRIIMPIMVPAPKQAVSR